MSAKRQCAECTYRPLAAALRAPVLLHGHAHPYGTVPPPLRLGRTAVRNVTGWQLFELGPGREPAEIIRGQRHAR
jgi:uncharacterized protein